jgi:hypothetical protein
MRKLVMTAAIAPLLAGGCVKTVVGVATAPVRVAGKAVGGGVDMLTTSSKERDAKWVRRQRKAEEARAKACKHDRSHCQPAQVAGR